MDDYREKYSQRIAVIENILSLHNHPGFVALKAEYEQCCKNIIEELLIEKDHLKIISLQERHRAFTSVKQALEILLREKECLEGELVDLQNDDQ